MAGKPKRKELVNKDWLYDQYITKRKSSVIIANELEITTPTVLRWLGIHNISTRSKSEAQIGRKYSEETLMKMSESQKSWLEVNIHPFLGKTHTSEHCEYMRRVRIGVPIHTEEQKQKYGEQVGEKNPNWQGGLSFEIYPFEFNHELREYIRNRDNRVCQLCGKSEVLNGRRLAVHHINGNKEDCRKENLTALCTFCNSKTDTVEKEFLIITNKIKLMSRG